VRSMERFKAPTIREGAAQRPGGERPAATYR
jgi:hypothetical protein